MVQTPLRSGDSFTTSVESEMSHHPCVGAGARAGACSEDLALVKQLLGGDEGAFAALVHRYHGRLTRLALMFVADRATAEEVVQETWLGVLNGLPSFEGRSTLKTWIFSILTNKARTRARRERRSVTFSALVTQRADDEPAVDPARFTSHGRWALPPERWEEDTPEQILLRHEARTLITKAIAGLPRHQRAVVTLRDVEGLDSAEVCHILQITGTNQRVLLHRARSKLRAVVERYLGDKQTVQKVSVQARATPVPRVPHTERQESRATWRPPPVFCGDGVVTRNSYQHAGVTDVCETPHMTPARSGALGVTERLVR